MGQKINVIDATVNSYTNSFILQLPLLTENATQLQLTKLKILWKSVSVIIKFIWFLVSVVCNTFFVTKEVLGKIYWLK